MKQLKEGLLSKKNINDIQKPSYLIYPFGGDQGKLKNLFGDRMLSADAWVYIYLTYDEVMTVYKNEEDFLSSLAGDTAVWTTYLRRDEVCKTLRKIFGRFPSDLIDEINSYKTIKEVKKSSKWSH